ncbi:MAG: fumarylacetoacetate hydrolase family protein, partial [Bacteroidetes bacterium]|nr:fumarylacetoacetate hydrolase family protein [Bacteroidota bacterium]
MRSLVLALTLAVALIAVAGCARPAQEDTDVYRRAALKAASWLQANALERPEGTVWAADPQDSTTVTTNLYSGSSGVVLFFLEAYRATGQPAYLDEARADAAIHHGAELKTIDHYGLFLKANSALVGPGEGIRLRFPERRNDHEVELAAVIGREGSDIAAERALDHVVG